MSLSDVSDLTELSSDNDSDVPLKTATKKKRAPKKALPEYQVKHALRPPRNAQYTAKSLYDQIIDEAIDLNPEYQRDVVWPESKQSGLIDSILRNYYIPSIVFAVTSTEDGSEVRTCIDGKQRLTSIQLFMDGQIPHKDSFTGEKLWYKQKGSTRRKLLPISYMTKFANKQITCVEYEGLSQDQEREIFQRVQLGVALTPAERMQAHTGPFPSLIRDISTKFLSKEGFDGYLEWGHARGRDFQCLASIAYLIDKFPKHTAPSTPQLEKWLQDTNPVPPKFREDLFDMFRIFVILARDKRYSTSLNKPTRVSPVEFVMIGVLINCHRKTLSLTQLSSAVDKLRTDVRSKHTDIRANSKVIKTMFTCITSRINVASLKSDGMGDKPAAGMVSDQSTKRKRRTSTNDDLSDSDTDVPPPRRAASPKPEAKGKSVAPRSAAKSQSVATKCTTSNAAQIARSGTQLKIPIPRVTRLDSASSSSVSTPVLKTSPVQITQPLQNTRTLPIRTTGSVQGQSGVDSLGSALSAPMAAPPKDVHTAGAMAIQSSLGTLPPPPGSSMIPLKYPPSSVMSPMPPTPDSSMSVQDRLAPIRAARAAIGGGGQIGAASLPPRPPPPGGQEIDCASLEAILEKAGLKPVSADQQQTPTPTQGTSASVNIQANVLQPNNGTPTVPFTLPSLLNKLGVQQPQSAPQFLAGNAITSVPPPNILTGVSSFSRTIPSGPRQNSTNYTGNDPPPPRPPIPAQNGLPPPPGSASSAPPPTSASSVGSYREKRRNSDHDNRSEHRRPSAPYDRDHRSHEYYSRRGSETKDRDRDPERNRSDRPRDSGWSQRGRDYSDRYGGRS